ncbi:hypothetical protein PMSD_21595 [Paenibacillus macquariensis subsp. defensor]|nr:hypothetical protein PMSD_21595 [Paenibacillus macquariensis subsp. defensor]
MIIVKSKTERGLMSEAEHVVTTSQLAEPYIRSQALVPSDKDYNGFLTSICTSVLVPGSSGIRKLNEDHIVMLDIRAEYSGLTKLKW